MKKQILFIILVFLFVMAITSCGSSEKPEKNPVKQPEEQVQIKSALALLKKVWNAYDDDEKFPAAGGDFNSGNDVMNEPGKFDISDSDTADSVLALSKSEISKVKEAASLIHMMNANTFTCGAFRVKKAGDVGTVAKALKENISKREWICGFPEKLVIITIDDYVVSCFGNGELVDTFKSKLKKAYKGEKIYCEETLASADSEDTVKQETDDGK